MKKILLIIMYSAAGVAAVCLIILFIVDLIYGDPKTIITDPHNPYIGKGAHYMNEITYEKYFKIVGTIHYIGWVSGMIFLILGIMRMVNQAHRNKGVNYHFPGGNK